MLLLLFAAEVGLLTSRQLARAAATADDDNEDDEDEDKEDGGVAKP